MSCVVLAINYRGREGRKEGSRGVPPSSEHEVNVCSLKALTIPPLLPEAAEICGVILSAAERYQ